MEKEIDYIFKEHPEQESTRITYFNKVLSEACFMPMDCSRPDANTMEICANIAFLSFDIEKKLIPSVFQFEKK